jgi:DNA-binding IclR family transcriptional regulator
MPGTGEVTPAFPYGKPAREAIRRYLRTQAQAKTTPEIAEATGYKRDTIGRAVRMLSNIGDIRMNPNVGSRYRARWELISSTPRVSDPTPLPRAARSRR